MRSHSIVVIDVACGDPVCDLRGVEAHREELQHRYRLSTGFTSPVGLQDGSVLWRDKQVLCVDDHVPPSSIPVANAAVEREVVIQEYAGLRAEDLEVRMAMGLEP